MSKKPFNIQERTFLFATEVIGLVKRLPRDPSGYALGRQLIRSGTSIGANVREADSAESRRDFVHKMKIALKEANETEYWLRLVQATIIDDEPLSAQIKECNEIIRILNTIIVNTLKKGTGSRKK